MPNETSENYIFNRKIAGIVCNPSGATSALALHGWLDNANSFAEMFLHVKNLRIQAIDLAGQGQSDFRSADAGYDLLDELRDMHALSEQQPSKHLHLVGHSRGAIIAAIFAATFPQRVASLVLIDAVEPFPSQIAELPTSVADSVVQASKLLNKTGSRYASRDDAIAARMSSQTPISQHAAELLAQRSLIQTEGGWCWRADQRLKGVSGFRITYEMREYFYARIAAPTLLIQGQSGMIQNDVRFAKAGQYIKGLERITVPGGHHCHLDGSAAQVAQLTEEWIASSS